MKRSDRITKEEVEKYCSIIKEVMRLSTEIRSITINTDSVEKERIVSEYDRVKNEKELLEKQIAFKKARMAVLFERIKEKSDGTDLAGFDEDMRDFFETFTEYYDFRKEQLEKLMDSLQQAEAKSLADKFRIWRAKVMVRKEMVRYDRIQKQFQMPIKG